MHKANTKAVLLSTYINTVNNETYALFGPVENFIRYLCQKFSNVYFISQPMPGEDDLTVTLSIYRDGKLLWIKKMPKFMQLLCWVNPRKVTSSQTVIRLKMRDFISNFYFITFCISHKLDLFIGVESINSLAAVILKKLGRIRTVLYFSNDYHTKKYTMLKNWLFLKLDEIAAYGSDYIWMMNPKIHESRIKRGLKPSKLAPHFIIHGGLPFFPGGPLPIAEREKNRIVYATRAGHSGLEIILQALSIVFKKYPDSRIYITGHTDKEKTRISGLIEKLKISQYIVFTGFIKEEELNRLVKHSYIGLAIWSYEISASATYGDPEKIRRYFHFGLPVVSTGNAFTAEAINKHGAGVVVDDKPESVAEAIIKLFGDKELYSKCAHASQELGKFYKENNMLDDSLEDLQKRSLL
ncbi:MAG: glycosyltransferase [Candidatus Humimicrobiaceae bacterium]